MFPGELCCEDETVKEDELWGESSRKPGLGL